EYNTANSSVAAPAPGPYDQQAIRYLYGQSPDLPTLPFCTDEDTDFDPNCVRFDTGVTPLTNSQIPRYRQLTGFLFNGQIPPAFTSTVLQTTGPQLLDYARAGTPSEALTAYQAALDGARPPLTAAQVANPVY